MFVQREDFKKVLSRLVYAEGVPAKKNETKNKRF